MTNDTIRRFLRYSAERKRPIRLMYTEDTGRIRAANMQIESFDETGATVTTLRPKKTFFLPAADVLSASYCKGDEGQED